MKQILSPFQQYECFEVDGVDYLVQEYTIIQDKDHLIATIVHNKVILNIYNSTERKSVTITQHNLTTVLIIFNIIRNNNLRHYHSFLLESISGESRYTITPEMDASIAYDKNLCRIAALDVTIKLPHRSHPTLPDPQEPPIANVR